MENQLLLEVAELKKDFLALPNAKALADLFLAIENNRNTLFLLHEKMLFKVNRDCTSDQLKQLEQRNLNYRREIALLADALTELDAMIAFWTGNDQVTTMPTEVDSVLLYSELSARLNLKHREYYTFLQSVSGELETTLDSQTLQQRFWEGLNAIQFQTTKLRGKGRKCTR